MTDRKGSFVGSIDNYVLRYSEQPDHNVVTTVRVGDLDLEGGHAYVIEIHNNGGRGGNKNITTTKVNTSQSGETVTIPTQVVRESDMLVPGQTVNIKVFEYAEAESQIADSTKVLDRTTVAKDKCVRDNCDSRLASQAVCEFLGNDRRVLKFRNTRTQEETKGTTHSNYDKEGYAVSFPISVREKISAQPGDLIEIISPAQNDDMELTNQSADKDVEQLIREMHSAMMDMYNDYLERQDD